MAPLHSCIASATTQFCTWTEAVVMGRQKTPRWLTAGGFANVLPLAMSRLVKVYQVLTHQIRAEAVAYRRATMLL
jgi:hypothetical protein